MDCFAIQITFITFIANHEHFHSNSDKNTKVIICIVRGLICSLAIKLHTNNLLKIVHDQLSHCSKQNKTLSVGFTGNRTTRLLHG